VTIIMNMQSNTPLNASKNNDYYTNHTLSVKWPFTIYHRPIEKSMLSAIAAARVRSGNALKVLVFGCGLFHEKNLFSRDFDLTLIDSDPRLRPYLLNQLAGFSQSKVVISSSAQELEALLIPESYDLIIAKEVIEHINHMDQYFSLFSRCLRDSGTLWLSTPNYGAVVLPLLEYTVLEVLARFQGFSRFGIHPNKYSKNKLRKELEQGGFKKIDVLSSPFWLALVASCQK
jgi:2-polyprenyl-3-methyl-5-hydroxy-6-metoxy-1,4-benzoquinol methylase